MRFASFAVIGALVVSACSASATTAPSSAPAQSAAAAQSAAPAQSAAAGQSAAPAQSAAAGGSPTGTLTIADWEFSEGVFGQNVEKVLKAYEQTHPGTTINFETMSYDSYPSTIKTQIGAGGGPDIMVLLDQDFYALEKAHDLAPLTALTPAEISSLRPANQTAVFGSDRLGYIWETVIYGLLYNKSLFSQAGISSAPTDFTSPPQRLPADQVQDRPVGLRGPQQPQRGRGVVRGLHGHLDHRLRRRLDRLVGQVHDQ